ncbi:DNA-processing protein DprA [Polynucleobacter necessarius]|uniref:DNA-processing protein DprA n=1 Tax=Polynucleobacter necessarius TaxID=576610 RepID=UPI0018D4FD96|nr:DNA-processing protein DprA [Polynucleobacter necessarius]
MIAIVGSRRASIHGLRSAHLFARFLARAGAVVVSGLARGIDGAAYAGALAIGPRTVAVCGTGLDITYLKERLALARAINRNGLLVSEFAPGVGPQAFHFPKRNRIIAALVSGVVVIEAAQKSGSLITARFAADLGREVFALPGPIDEPLHAGCHELIQQGATLVCEPNEMLEDLNFL